MTTRRDRRRQQASTGTETIEAAVLRATEELLGKQALDEIAVADILAGSGASRTSFYFYFESKDAVAAALLRHIAHDFRAAMALWVGESDQPRLDALRDAVRETVRIWRRHRGVLRAAYEAPPHSSEIGQVWESILDGYVTVAAGHIETERAAGRAPAGPDPATLARILIGANNQAFYHHVMAGETDDGFVDALAHVWAAGIYGHPGGAPGS
ncbi:TetR/AcrR family transcriptional regulator [Amycolatopsis cynarae]|uniref:TetR/AcrR family transcriptional regulator n=1 Tax=Amycolatopsis cynarae TaxID=2995223 RepID=A0ABY7B7E1_9PSEU|nr:TetR/AcrR family transcriptional regulator [Amycolatopsis sp. HUAS 11-8]WAL68252.1 TetR/AcrR family transcriptional regulator [Amycolatopsis sp. HUAS 11-8]